MRHTHLFMPLALVSAMAAVQQVYAADEFIARDIKIQGLVRLSPASVSTMLPINSGDRVDDAVISMLYGHFMLPACLMILKLPKKMTYWYLMWSRDRLFLK